MKTVGIVTFHGAHNYGSALQAFALQNKIKELGYKCEIINYRTELQKEAYSVIDRRKGIRVFLKNLYVRFFILKGRQEKFELFEEFLNHRLILSKEINTYSQFEEMSSNYDYLIAGSDQIWNFKAEDFSEIYLLPGVNKRKITYAVSTGANLTCQDFTKESIDCIKNIDCLSVRDQATADMIKAVTNRIPEVVIDPTMLYGPEFYDRFISPKPVIKEPYIYLYSLRDDAGLADIAKKISKKMDLPVYISHVSGMSYMFSFKKVISSGPLEFINHIKYAEFVLTSSFHGSIFSTLYHKQFWIYKANDDNRKKEMIRMLEIPDRSIEDDTWQEKYLERIEESQFKKMDNIILSQREKAINFLTHSLEDID